VPRPRFARLPAEKKAAILEAAALEFGALGFADASINHILEVAGISKGAAYYYFDDKEDLFLTVVRHFSAQLGIDDLRDLADQLTAEKFWSGLAELFRIPLASSFESPTAFGVLRAAGELWRTKPQGEDPWPLSPRSSSGFCRVCSNVASGWVSSAPTYRKSCYWRGRAPSTTPTTAGCSSTGTSWIARA